MSMASEFRKSSYSIEIKDHCVETRWRKSTYSYSNGDCTEARTSSGLVQVRDSKDPGPVLAFSPAAWEQFTDGIKEAS